jgi:hypothetical protein
VLLATFKAEANGFVVVKSTLEHHCTPAANSSAIRHKGFMTKHTVSKTDIGVLCLPSHKKGATAHEVEAAVTAVGGKATTDVMYAAV